MNSQLMEYDFRFIDTLLLLHCTKDIDAYLK